MHLEAETLITMGGEIKALGDGRVGGYLVRFGSPGDTDLEGEFFTADTDFGPAKTSLVFYHHALDGSLKRRVLDDDAEMRKDETGIWIEAQLEMRDEYEKFIYEQAQAGRMGWSSGTAGHLIERVPMGKATWIKSWPLGLDASITPTPAEPRNAAVPLKSWLKETEQGAEAQAEDGAQPSPDADAEPVNEAEPTNRAAVVTLTNEQFDSLLEIFS